MYQLRYNNFGNYLLNSYIFALYLPWSISL